MPETEGMDIVDKYVTKTTPKKKAPAHVGGGFPARVTQMGERGINKLGLDTASDI